MNARNSWLRWWKMTVRRAVDVTMMCLAAIVSAALTWWLTTHGFFAERQLPLVIKPLPGYSLYAVSNPSSVRQRIFYAALVLSAEQTNPRDWGPVAPHSSITFTIADEQQNGVFHRVVTDVLIEPHDQIVLRVAQESGVLIPPLVRRGRLTLYYGDVTKLTPLSADFHWIECSPPLKP